MKDQKDRLLEVIGANMSRYLYDLDAKSPELVIAIKLPEADAKKLREHWADYKRNALWGGSLEAEISEARIFGVRYLIEGL